MGYVLWLQGLWSAYEVKQTIKKGDEVVKSPRELYGDQNAVECGGCLSSASRGTGGYSFRS